MEGVTLCPSVYKLQNSPYFCLFKYARAVKQKIYNETGERRDDIFEPPGRNELIVWKTNSRFLFLSPHTPYGRVRLARVRLLRHALPIFFTDFEKKKNPTVLQSIPFISIKLIDVIGVRLPLR